MTTTRLLHLADAPVLARMEEEDRAFFAPWGPAREESWFTEEGQREEIGTKLGQHRLGLCLPHVVLDDAGEIIGRISLNNVVRGAFQSASLGYGVRSSANGRGHATAATAIMLRTAFEDLRLHRVEAGTPVHNAASQRVLERNGSRASAWHRSTCASPAAGRTTCSSRASPRMPQGPAAAIDHRRVAGRHAAGGSHPTMINWRRGGLRRCGARPRSRARR